MPSTEVTSLPWRPWWRLCEADACGELWKSRDFASVGTSWNLFKRRVSQCFPKTGTKFPYSFRNGLVSWAPGAGPVFVVSPKLQELVIFFFVIENIWKLHISFVSLVYYNLLHINWIVSIHIHLGSTQQRRFRQRRSARQTSGLGHADAGEDPRPTRLAHQLGQGIQGAAPLLSWDFSGRSVGFSLPWFGSVL